MIITRAESQNVTKKKRGCDKLAAANTQIVITHTRGTHRNRGKQT